MEDHGDAGVLGAGPHRVEPDVAGGVTRWAGRRDHQRLAAHGEGLVGHGRGPLEVGEGEVTDGEQARVDGAEVDHGPVVGASEAVGVVEVARVLDPLQFLVRERVEHQLAGEAEDVKGPAAVLADERAGGPPVLAQHDLGLVAGAVVGVAVQVGGLVDERVLARLHGGHEQRLHAVAHPGVGVVDEPGRRLHQVGVGVVDGATFRVRHETEPRVRGPWTSW